MDRERLARAQEELRQRNLGRQSSGEVPYTKEDRISEMRDPLPVRFERAIRKTGDCWGWVAWKDRHGYGRIQNNGKKLLAHRVSWELSVGPIPEGKLVLHKCDNPECVKPEHLYLGDQKQNMVDRKERRGARTGARNPNAKLTREKARDIRRMRAHGVTRAEVAAQFGVSTFTIASIEAGRSWKRWGADLAQGGGGRKATDE